MHDIATDWGDMTPDEKQRAATQMLTQAVRERVEESGYQVKVAEEGLLFILRPWASTVGRTSAVDVLAQVRVIGYPHSADSQNELEAVAEDIERAEENDRAAYLIESVVEVGSDHICTERLSVLANPEPRFLNGESVFQRRGTEPIGAVLSAD